MILKPPYRNEPSSQKTARKHRKTGRKHRKQVPVRVLVENIYFNMTYRETRLHMVVTWRDPPGCTVAAGISNRTVHIARYTAVPGTKRQVRLYEKRVVFHMCFCIDLYRFVFPKTTIRVRGQMQAVIKRLRYLKISRYTPRPVLYHTCINIPVGIRDEKILAVLLTCRLE